jgi:hypothetical protein
VQQQLHETLKTLKAAEEILESLWKTLDELRPATFGQAAPEMLGDLTRAPLFPQTGGVSALGDRFHEFDPP